MLPPDVGPWIAGQRWFASKTRRIVAAAAEDEIALGGATLWLVRVELDDGRADRYAVPLLAGAPPRDALDDPGFCRTLLALALHGDRAVGLRGTVAGEPTRACAAATPSALTPRRVAGEQSNTSVVFGDAIILKQFRRLALGVNPDLEMTRFLTERTAYRHTPRLLGGVQYVDAAGSWALAMAQELVAEGQDGWRWLLERLAAGDGALPALARLGRRTAELHVALAGATGDPAFEPEPITSADVAAWTTAVEQQLGAARNALRGRLPEALPALRDGLDGLVGAAKTRLHGDFHLGQTLTVRQGDDWMLIDFEGEPLRPLAERRRKHTPLRDVAGMLRSLGYAAASVTAPPGWEADARRAFLAGYRGAAHGAAFLPSDEAAFARAVAVLEVEKAAYEVVYEANNRPDWIEIPVQGVLQAARRVTARVS
jgi:maltose alpha-D-glucosyltransferase/alpha-amylase